MNRMRGVALAFLGLSLVLLAALLTSTVAANAGSGGDNPSPLGSGANWKVTVRNDSDKPCNVSIWVHRGPMAPQEHDKKPVSPGGVVTLETGSLCPCALSGTVTLPGGASRTLQAVCVVSGAERSDAVQACEGGQACYNSSWFITLKHGDGTADNDYGFFKM